MTEAELDSIVLDILPFLDRLATIHPNAKGTISSVCANEVARLLSKKPSQTILKNFSPLYQELIKTASADGLLAPAVANSARRELTSLLSLGTDLPKNRILAAINAIMLWNAQNTEKFFPTAGLIAKATGYNLPLIQEVLDSCSSAIQSKFRSIGIQIMPHNYGRSVEKIVAFIKADLL
jgi:hypothetical protein